MKFKWLGKRKAEDTNRTPDDELKKRLAAKVSAYNIRRAAASLSREINEEDEEVLESTFEVTPHNGDDDDLVFIADGSNIGVEEMTFQFDPSEDHLDFGREVAEVKTAWGSLDLSREEANYKKEEKL